jgi:hypothetical protein
MTSWQPHEHWCGVAAIWVWPAWSLKRIRQGWGNSSGELLQAKACLGDGALPCCSYSRQQLRGAFCIRAAWQAFWYLAGIADEP